MMPRSNYFCHETLILTGLFNTSHYLKSMKAYEDVAKLLVHHGAAVNYQDEGTSQHDHALLV